MANDNFYFIKRETLHALADKIRLITGTPSKLRPSEMINQLETYLQREPTLTYDAQIDKGKVISKTGDGSLRVQTSTTVTENGVIDTTYYDSVNVNVPSSSSSQDNIQLISLNATDNYRTYEPEPNYAFNRVTVNVSTSLTNSDVGKVVINDNGRYKLAQQTTRSDPITVNNTYDTTNYNEVTVQVPTGVFLNSDAEGKVVKQVNNDYQLVNQTKHATITSNGSNIDMTYNNAVDVNVPNTYSASDEGSIVVNGQLSSRACNKRRFQQASVDGGYYYIETNIDMQNNNFGVFSGSSTFAQHYNHSSRGSQYIFRGWKLISSPSDDLYSTTYEAIFNTGPISDTWTQIIASSEDGTYATKYNIGDIKELDLGNEGIITMVLIAKDTDLLANSNERAHMTWISNKALNTQYIWNNALNTEQTAGGTIDGWRESAIRSYLNSTIKLLMPNEVQNGIKAVLKYHNYYSTSTNAILLQTTTDNIWIPSLREIGYTHNNSYDVRQGITYRNIFTHLQYRTIPDNNYSHAYWLRDIANISSAIEMHGQGDYSEYWSKSVDSTNNIVLGFCL